MMKVHYDLNKLPVFTNPVITIGTFDGVHSGHQQIMAQLKKEAAKVNGETVIITFHPHPRKIVSGQQVFILTTLPEKIILLEKSGIDHLIVVPFNEAFSQQSAEEYIDHFLVDKIHPHTIIIGYDHKFGKGRSGNYQLLESYGEKRGFEVKEIPEHILNEVTVSSTQIRNALLKNNLEMANKYLGYPYFFEGEVVHGNKLGRELGYPTANIAITEPEKLVPANGIYAVQITIEGQEKTYDGMLSIGIRPTVGGKHRTIEVNIFDFDEDIYGKTCRVFLYAYLREELKFDNLSDLQNAMHLDKKKSIGILSKYH